MLTRRQALSGLGAVIASPLALTAVFAQSGYPNRPITLVVPFAAGGNTDVVARIIVERMSQIFASASSSRMSAAPVARRVRFVSREPSPMATPC